jgi:S-adenosylmethionine synthetase
VSASDWIACDDFMEIRLINSNASEIDKLPIEVVERKGIGHPDTLADMVAEMFSSNYSKYCIRNFGVIPNHYADKVTLVGGQVALDFGRVKLISPTRAFLFGRITPKVGNDAIPVSTIFGESVYKVLSDVFGKDSGILDNVEVENYSHASAGPDHPRGFYDPKTPEDVKRVQSELRANDTVVCTSYAGYSKLEKIVIEVENYLNSGEFKKEYKETGYDIKVLGVRVQKKLDLTICIPFLASMVSDFSQYKNVLKQITSTVEEKIKKIYPEFSIGLHINTKDREKDSVYLTAFGTALDKGDIGAVGRGNRYNGLITPMREMAIEAHSGKNPVSHAGKLYSAVLADISKEIYLKYNKNNSLNLISYNGDILEEPAFIFAKFNEDVTEVDTDVKTIICSKISNTRSYTKRIIERDPVYEHVNGPREMYDERIK